MDEGDKSLARRGDTINAEHRTAEEYCVRRAEIHMRAVAGIIGNGFRKPRHVFLRLEHF
jgi:hypothetical protein